MPNYLSLGSYFACLYLTNSVFSCFTFMITGRPTQSLTGIHKVVFRNICINDNFFFSGWQKCVSKLSLFELLMSISLKTCLPDNQS